MNLHSIIAPGSQAWAWVTPVGENGQVVGRGGYQHAYLIDRGTPPPIGANARRYWTPWYHTVREVNALNPLCGDLRSTARNPRLDAGFWWDKGHCPRCEDIMLQRNINIRPIRNLSDADPWTQIGWLDRPNAIDPETGA